MTIIRRVPSQGTPSATRSARLLLLGERALLAFLCLGVAALVVASTVEAVRGEPDPAVLVLIAVGLFLIVTVAGDLRRQQCRLRRQAPASD